MNYMGYGVARDGLPADFYARMATVVSQATKTHLDFISFICSL